MIISRSKVESFVILTIISLFLPLSGSGQVCSGTLGENIFTNGDFGSGFDNVVQTNPQIAPGYLYETNPPPQDGKYTITNYTGVWNLFEGWIGIYDNSPDVKGYMMVVNASFDPGLFYSQEITGLCENTIYEFTADIINLLATGSNMIKPDVSFLLNGIEMYTTGDIPENETWNTYGFTFETQAGQETLTLSLRNNAPGGQGNDLALDNISFRPCGPEAVIVPGESITICADNDPITLEAVLLDNTYPDPVLQWQVSSDGGVTWTNIDNETDYFFTHTNLIPGSYFYRFLVANGDANLSNYKCRIASTEKEIVVLPKYTYFIDTICNGLSVDFGGVTYSQTGIYHDSLKNYLGCDSIIVLDLTVTPDLPMYSTHTVINPPCSDVHIGTFFIDTVYNGTEPYVLNFDGNIYNISQKIENLAVGEYHYNLSDRYGCTYNDSIVINPSASFTIDLGEDLIIELGESIHLIPESSIQIDNYLWGPTGISNCADNCTELVYTPLTTMYIYAQATSEENCTITDSVLVQVIKSRKVVIPNAFTPNNDGLNDYFTVFGTVPNVQMIEKMQIFDRWGNNIYTQKNFIPNEPNTGWDGTYEGTILKTGSFVYTIDVRFIDNEVVTYHGVVTLIR